MPHKLADGPPRPVDALWWAHRFVMATVQHRNRIGLARSVRSQWHFARLRGTSHLCASLRTAYHARLLMCIEARTERRRIWALYQAALTNDKPGAKYRRVKKVRT